jgi:7-cyano-7-deazaguanine synthase in queuosine biosynthesis
VKLEESSRAISVCQSQGSKIFLKPKKQVSLVMLSSGLDSLYVLVKLLTETDDIVLVHHVQIINNENRHEIEAERTRRIIDWCRRKYRGFRYSESIINHNGFQGFGFDIMSVAFEAGMVCRSFYLANKYPVSKLLTGWCAEEEPYPGRPAHVRAVVTANCFPFEPPRFFYFDRVSKMEEAQYLPPELVDMSWTCRRPVIEDGQYSECGECPSCEVMRPVREKIEMPIELEGIL